MSASIAVEHVRKTFGEKVRALDDVSLEVAAGDFALLTGPSGSGKSTLLNLIAGFDRPDRGRVLVDDIDVARIEDPARYRREVVGIVFQLHHLIPALTAEENVEVPMIPVIGRRSERLERARAALAEVGLAERSDHRPSELSGGERQRVAVARALVGRPRLLLADEPTGSLDSAAGTHVLELLSELRERHGMTVLLVSYDPSASRYANRVFRIRDGRIESADGRTGRETLTPVPR